MINLSSKAKEKFSDCVFRFTLSNGNEAEDIKAPKQTDFKPDRRCTNAEMSANTSDAKTFYQDKIMLYVQLQQYMNRTNKHKYMYDI